MYHNATGWAAAMDEFVYNHDDTAVRENTILDFIAKCNMQIMVTETTWEYTHTCSKKLVFELLRIIRSIPNTSSQSLFCSTVEQYSTSTVRTNIISSVFCAKIHLRHLEAFDKWTFVEPVLEFGPETKVNIKINNILIHEKFNKFSRLIKGIYIISCEGEELNVDDKVNEMLKKTNIVNVYQEDEFKVWICNSLDVKEMLKIVDEVDTVEKFISTTIPSKKLIDTFIEVQTYFNIAYKLMDENSYFCDY
jgi:hypothetical protein